MFSKASALAFLIACQQYGVVAQPSWPASIDELEDIMFLNSGYRARGFATPVTPCSKGVSAGRVTAAEWVRTIFHEAINGNVYTGSGGVDGSMQYELGSSENAGNFAPSTIGMFAPFVNSRLSLADIEAVALYSAVRSCGGPVVPVRGGRVDATGAGSSGFVPQPQNSVGIFTNQFARLGLDGTGMIQLVACGHSLGGVHASDNPDIVTAGTFPNDFATLDTTASTFDSRIATEYVAGTTKNPLVVGKSVTNGRNSDGRVFANDNNVTIKAMQDATVFANTCKTVFQKMIEVVPNGVKLSDPITPYTVKPYDLQLTLLAGGSKIKFSGDIRIRTSQLSGVAQVQLVYKDRTGSTVSKPIDTTVSGTASGFDDTFTFFGFSAELSADTSISSFNVLVTLAGGSTQTFDNNGNGFKVDDTVIYQTPQSCLSSAGKLTVVAAVRSGASSPSIKVVVKNAQASPNPVPSLSTATAPMATQSALGSYQLYSADYTFSGSQASSAVFGVFAGSSSDNYKTPSGLPTACSPLSSSPPTSTPSSSAFAFQGCYYDAGAPRALASSASFDGAMTVEKCATFCSSYQLFGVEYGGECYCGNSLDATSTIRALSDCNMACGGNPNQTCGAGNRINLYKNLKYSPPGNPQIAGYEYKGCYSEGSAGRALSDSATSSDTMSVDACAAFCSSSTYFGLEYARECYCGSILNAGSTLQTATDCNMLCAGNSTEYCGAGNRLNIYQKVAVSSSSSSPFPTPTSSSTSSSSSVADSTTTVILSTTSTTMLTSTVVLSSSPSDASSFSTPTPSSTVVSSSSSSSSSSIPTPTPTGPTYPGYNYVGCLTDNVANRTLIGKSRSVSTNSYADCASFCSGYQFFGLEYSAECYCSNTLSYLLSNPSTDCAMSCAGDSTSPCGGPNRLTVFNSTTPITQPGTSSIPGYAYAGCYIDSVGARTLADGYFFDAAMTNEKCAQSCEGAKYFGTEYGGECYCGTSGFKQGSAAVKVSDGECGMLCGGNTAEFCGDGNRLSVYVKLT